MARVLEFITRIFSRQSNRDLDIEIFERERDQERARVLDEIASSETWDLDWARERHGWIGEKDDYLWDD